MRVFKYRGGDDAVFIRDLDSLVNDFFWAPTSDRLNDPCEGLVSSKMLIKQIDIMMKMFAKNNENIADSAESLKQALYEILDKKNTAGIYSLSRNSTDELLWAHYANSHYGFCIEYELNTLVSFGKNDYFNFDVKYSSNPPKLTVNDMLKIDDKVRFIQKLIGIKSKKWAYEKEIRVITSEAGSQSYDFRAVKAIHFGLRMPDEKIKKVMEKLKGRDIKYYQVELNGNSYKILSKPIVDKYPTKNKYLYSVAPIAEYAVDPSTLNKKWSEYTHYLQKMAEIVRREPYCNEVQMVEVSHDKSKLGKPVFFGQYQRSKFRYENLYLTPKEIDEKYSQIRDIGGIEKNV